MRYERKLPTPYNAMSEDAQTILRNLFALGDPTFSITFGNEEARISDRAKKAFDELVEKEVLCVLTYGKTVQYSPRKHDQPIWKRLPRFGSAKGLKLTAPID